MALELCDHAFAMSLAIKRRVRADRRAHPFARALGKPLGPVQLVNAGQQIIRTCRVIPRPDRRPQEPYPSALPARTDRRGLLAGHRPRRLGDRTVSSAFAEHIAYAGSTAGACAISLQPPG
jgi:hypothetical protein